MTPRLGPDGTRRWFLGGQLHRLGGPAVERDDGSKEWYQHGWVYRIEFTDGRTYFTDGRTHSWLHGLRPITLDAKP